MENFAHYNTDEYKAFRLQVDACAIILKNTDSKVCLDLLTKLFEQIEEFDNNNIGYRYDSEGINNRNKTIAMIAGSASVFVAFLITLILFKIWQCRYRRYLGRMAEASRKKYEMPKRNFEASESKSNGENSAR